MCGINGIISIYPIPSKQERILAMNKSIEHRGPDADGFKIISDGVVVGHRRLSILDLDVRSNQPMQLRNGNKIIVFNGEIFNFKEIRKELICDYDFITNSDTEVLLVGLELKSIEWVLERANGMFAFAVYDTQSSDLIIARDRFGIKPLYYFMNDDLLIFSSEIKGILSSGLIQPEFNSEAIDDYLGNRYVREPNTFFKKIKQVRSSTYLKFNKYLEFEEFTYWKLPELNFETGYNEKQVIKDTHDVLYAAFQRWFISDVSVGAYLSGGVDSSLTSAILSKEVSHLIDTYTIGFEEEDYNEFVYAKEIADLYKTNHHTIICNEKDYLNEWDLLIGFKDAPLAVPNEVPLAQMSSALKKDMTVVISGEGADELFGGYGRIYRSAFDYSNKPEGKTFYEYFINNYEYVSRSLRDKYLNIDYGNLRTFYDNKNQNDFQYHRNEENIFRFFHSYHIQGLLNRVDMTTMQTSVEARPPFLDHKLVEYVYTQIPYEMKLHWNTVDSKKQAESLTASRYSEVLDCPKYVLKKIAEQYLPVEIIYRKKMGFPVPLSKWFSELDKLAFDLLSNASWLNQNELFSLIEDLKTNERSGQLLWMFMNVQMFYNKYFTRKWIW